jgi:hypothetical protein
MVRVVPEASNAFGAHDGLSVVRARGTSLSVVEQASGLVMLRMMYSAYR